ncbi:MAG: vitamin K epoxide reductase family protein [Patescibacteria group bacterium]
MLMFALFGFADASYLSAEHFTGGTPVCTVIQGCDIVTTSVYATIGPVPVALLGAVYYFALILGLVVYLDKRSVRWLRSVAFLPMLGFGFTLYLVYLMAFVIDAWCIYCLGSATSTIVLFVLALFILWRTRTTVSRG